MRYFKLPDLGEGLQEAEIVEWLVSPGDTVTTDQIIVTVETAKAIVEIPAPCDGTLAQIFGKPGDIIHVGEPLVEFADGQDNDSGTVVGNLGSQPTPHAGQEEHFYIGAPPHAPRGNLNTAPKASPAVRKLAEQHHISLEHLHGSGPNGRITLDDIEQAMALDEKGGPAQPLKGVRRQMAINMARARDEVVQVTLFDDIDITHLSRENLTLAIIFAIGKACRDNPLLNAWYDGQHQTLRPLKTVDLGIAVDTPEGLFVPVLRNLNQRSETDISQGFEQLKRDVKARRIPPGELLNPSITLSNFGTLAGRYGTPVVVPPTVAIVGTGQVFQQPVREQDEWLEHSFLPVSLSFDHRPITGGEASRFLASFSHYLRSS